MTPLESPQKLTRLMGADEALEVQALGAVAEGDESEAKTEPTDSSDSDNTCEGQEEHTAAEHAKEHAATATAKGVIRAPGGPLEGHQSCTSPRDARPELDYLGREQAKAKAEKREAAELTRAKKEQAAEGEPKERK